MCHHKQSFDCYNFLSLDRKKNLLSENLISQKETLPVTMGRFRRAFTAKEKLAAIAHAEAHGNRPASHEFSIDESQHPPVEKAEAKTTDHAAQETSQQRSSEKLPQIEEKVLEFEMEHRRCGQSVSTTEIRIHGTKVAMSIKTSKLRLIGATPS